MKFVHLHVHSHYSLLDGLSKIDELVARAKEEGAPALALTDHGVMYGAIEFYQKCKKAGIKPIIGVEAYLAPGSRFDKNTRSDEKNYHLVLLAKNQAGYKNLIKLTSSAHLEGYYYKPRIDWEILKKHSEGVIAMSACIAGEIARLIISGKEDKARKRILEYQELFGKDDFYLEIQHHPNLEHQDEVNKKLIQLSRELDAPLAATNDSHYLNKEDDEAQDVLICLQTKKKKGDRDRMSMIGEDYSLRAAGIMEEVFKDAPEAIENTVKIAEKCNLEIELGQIHLPHFEVPGGYNKESYLRKLCEEGLIKRYGKNYNDVESKIKERMDYELLVVNKMGWPSYFLIVADFVNWAKNSGIVVGPGRGSAAGSLVSYLTGITNLDPLKYDLLFERFLNPDRISMPDIDLDFADIRREEVIRYVEDKYGKDHVAQIITFGTMAARAAVRDVGRVLDAPYDYCDKLAKMIPMFTKINKALEIVEEFKDIYEKEEMAKQIINFAKRLEGVARHASTHACGVLITKNPLTDYVPIQYASSSDKTIVSQYSLHPVEDLGLLKMDFLGLKNLTIIESALKIIKNTRGLEIDIDKIPLDDEKAYKLFQDGETTGIFQFESSGMKRYLRELKPTEFEDIIAMVALYRPGPMEWIPDYIAGKHGKKKPQYLHLKLEPILAKTYGVAIYQEQVMQIARILAGFTMGEADVLRKAMGKKIPKLLAEQKEKFIAGCVKNNIAKKLAETIFSFIEPFAGYGFNRSHAACYAMVAYQTAYLKANWPTEFMAALLTSDQENTDRVAIEIEECRNMGIEVLPPDINQSFDSFTVVTSGTALDKTVDEAEQVKTIRFGLKAIKNVGGHIAEVIIQERKKNGPYKDLSDLLGRINDKDLNKKSLESLAKSGSLELFGDRGYLLGNMENILSFTKEVNQNRNNGQASLFANAPVLRIENKVKLVQAPSASRQEKLSWEKELLGLYITEHPFADYKKYLQDKAAPLRAVASYSRSTQVRVAGIITKIKKIITKSNEAMLFVKIEDQTNSVEILVFPSVLKETAAVWQEGKAVLCEGKLSDKDQEVKLLCNKAIELTLGTVEKIAAQIDSLPADSYAAKRSQLAQIRPAVDNFLSTDEENLYIVFKKNYNPSILNKLKELLEANKGEKKVFFKINSSNIETNFKSNYNEFLKTEINHLLGSN